jgi:1-deoxy-D-xylulose-5-phosphate reductoisomerase
MRGPISYALWYPRRLPLELPRLDLAKIGQLTFFNPDPVRFPCIGFAYDAMRYGGTLPAVLNAANEEAVGAFLNEEIPFTGIASVIRRTMEAHVPKPINDLEDVLMADQWARAEACRAVKMVQCSC